MVCTVLAGQNKWDHCTHLTWNLGHMMKWDHYKHPLSYHFVLCWGDLFSLDHVCGHPYALLKGQCVYGLYSFGGAEQVRPLHTPYLKSGSQDEVRPLQAPLIISLCALLGGDLLSLDYICGYQYELLKGQFVYGLYSFAWTEQVIALQASYLKTRSLTEVRPLEASLIISLCALLRDVFSLDHLCGYQYELLMGQCVYGLYSFGGAEKVRPLHTPYLKSGSQDEVRPLQAPLIISLCALLGWSFLIRSCLWISICAPKGSVCLWFVQFWRGRKSETTAHTLLEIWVTWWSETTTSTPYHITLCFVGVIFSH